MWHRKPAVSGSFYPSQPDDINRLIKSYMEGAGEGTLSGSLQGLVVPHAGYVYSGPVAAYSYALLKEMNPEVVIVLAPSHRARFRGASIIPEGIYETPLGEVEIDKELGSKLIGKKHFSFLQEAHMYEHSLEVQVPFLQYCLESFTLVPVIVGTTELEICTHIAEELYSALIKETRTFLIVISTDLSHFYSYDTAERLDKAFIDNLKLFNAHELSQILQKGKAEACGQGPVLTGLQLCKKLGSNEVKILKYANSGDTAGTKDQVVGYLAAAIGA